MFQKWQQPTTFVLISDNNAIPLSADEWKTHDVQSMIYIYIGNAEGDFAPGLQ